MVVPPRQIESHDSQPFGFRRELNVEVGEPSVMLSYVRTMLCREEEPLKCGCREYRRCSKAASMLGPLRAGLDSGF